MTIPSPAVESSAAPTLPKSSSVSGGMSRAKFERACSDFEAMLVGQMLKVMRESALQDGDALSFGDNSPFQSLFDWEIARDISRKMSLGVAESLTRHVPDEYFTEQSSVDAPPAPIPVVPTRRYGLEAVISRASNRNGIDADLLRAVIECESGGDPAAVSHKGAKGLMQLMDSTASRYGAPDPLDPAQNVTAGAAYLRDLIDRYDGDLETALAAYNAGPTAVDRYGGVPPYPETRTYIRRVLAQYRAAAGK